MSGFGVDPLLEERASAEWAGMFDHIDQDTRDDDAATTPARAAETVEPARCNKPLYKLPLHGSVHGFRWVRCTRTVDEFGDCRDCDR